MNNKYNEDDFCDLTTTKVCDNCGKCLELEGVDTKAIRIEDIAKKVEENEVVVADLSSEESVQVSEEESEIDIMSEFNIPEDDEGEYEDAFDHIEYIEDMDLNDDLMLEELTEEIYPGVRKFKNGK